MEIIIYLLVVFVTLAAGFIIGALWRDRSRIMSAGDVMRPLSDGEAIIEVLYSNGKRYRMIESGVWIEIGKDGKQYVRP